MVVPEIKDRLVRYVFPAKCLEIASVWIGVDIIIKVTQVLSSKVTHPS
jgi:hypothetical protein